MDPKNTARPLTEDQATQQATVQYLTAHYPKLSDEMAGYWAQLIAEEEKKGETGGHGSEKKTGMAPELRNKIEAARKEFRATFEGSNEALLAEFSDKTDRLREIMQDAINIARDSEGGAELVAFIKTNKANVPAGYMADIRNDLQKQSERIFENATKERILDIQLLIGLLGKGAPGEQLVDFDTIIANNLERLIKEGNLLRAVEVARTVNQMWSAGFRGKSYFDQFQSLPHYAEVLKAGYAACLRTNSSWSVMPYRNEAERNGIDLTEIEKTVPTSLDLKALANDYFPFVA